MEAKRRFLIGLPFMVVIGFFAGTCLAQPQSLITRSTPGDGELKSAGSDYGEYIAGDKVETFGAVGGGRRGYQYVTNSSKSPGKRGARGAVDGVPDAGNSSKTNTFTTTVLADTMRVGQTRDGNYQVFKAFLSFNTSAIPSDAAITSADLIFYGKAVYIDGDIPFDIEVVKSVYTEPLWNPDWGATMNLPSDVGLPVSAFHFDPNAAADPNSAKNVISIGSVIADALVERGGITKIALVSSRTKDKVEPAGNEFVEIFSADAVERSLRPRLVVNYNGNAPEISPLLTWIAGDVEFKDKGVDQAEVYTGTTTLTFRVRYIYDDGQGGLGIPPESAKLWLDINNNNTPDADDMTVDMQPTDTLDNDYSDGKDYQADVEIVSDGVTNIGYRFLFTADGKPADGDPAYKNLIVSLQEPKSSSGDDKFCFISSLR